MDTENGKQGGFSLWRIVPYALIAVIIFSLSSCFFGGGGKMKRDTWYSYNEMPQLKVQNAVVDAAVERGMDVYFAYYPYCHKCDDLCEPIRYDYIEARESKKTDSYTCDRGHKITLRFKLEY